MSTAFLRLTPCNDAAKDAFHDLLNDIIGKPPSPQLIHTAQYMFCGAPTPPTETPDPPRTLEDELVYAFINGSESEDADDINRFREPPRLQGFYFLSFDIPPKNVNWGWQIGSGRSDVNGRPPRLVDLLLVPPNTPFSKYRLRQGHACISFDKYGLLVLRATSRHSPAIYYHTESFGSQRLLVQERAIVSFGRLDYTLEYKVNSEMDYQRQLRQYFEEYLILPAPNPKISVTPKYGFRKLDNWCHMDTVATSVHHGTTIRIYAAKNTRTGEPGAMKWWIRDQGNHQAVAEEIRMLKALPAHPQLLRLVDVWYEDGRQEQWEPYPFHLVRHDPVAITCTPFVQGTVERHLIFLSKEQRLAAFRQLLQGVVALHGQDIMHRDIKLHHWGVVDPSSSPENLTTVILDYAHATTIEVNKFYYNDSEPKVGTEGYRAPEMEDSCYDQLVDVWACGIIGMQLFVTEGELKWGKVDDPAEVWQYLPTERSDDIYELIRMMLSPVEERISAKDALGHACFGNMTPINDQHLPIGS